MSAATVAAPTAPPTAVWEALLAAALVGTARRPVPPEATAGLVDLDPATVAAGPEAVLLASAAVVDAYRRAGWTPPIGPPPPAPAPDDDRPVAPRGAVQILDLLLAGDLHVPGGAATVLGEWLTRAAATGRRPPHRLLPPLLRYGTGVPAARPAIAAAAGPRGRWLAERVPEWWWVAPAGGGADGSPEREWPLGSRPRRLALLAEVRAADPDRGRALVRSTWATESAADRAAFVEALGADAVDADEPFLEAALDDRAASVRHAAAAVLDGLPRSRRAARMADRSRSWVRIARGRDRLLVDLDPPDELDDAARRDGIVDRVAGVGGGPPTSWAAQVVTGTPLAAWEARTGVALDELARLTSRSRALEVAWRQAAVRQRDARWAAALFAVRPDARLLPVLDADDARRLVTHAATAGAGSARLPGSTLQTLLEACPGPWPLELSREVLDRLDATGKVKVSLAALLPTLAGRLHPDVAPLVDEWAARTGRDTPTRRQVRALHHALTLRSAIAKELR